MCGRYVMARAVGDLLAEFDAGLEEEIAIPPSWNVAPTADVPILLERLVDGEPVRQLHLARWGLVPSWAKEIGASPLINARADTLFDKPSFRQAARRRRCLFPADGFYEWRRDGRSRKPFLVRRRDRGLFAMAGIWEHWVGADGSELESAAIVTTDANATLAPIHHRMPVILDTRDFDAWLTTAETEAPGLARLLVPAPDDVLDAVAVSERVNKVANDDAALLEPVAEDEAPADGPQMKLL
jgi:putative SOS response-associated peptidase YedK